MGRKSNAVAASCSMCHPSSRVMMREQDYVRRSTLLCAEPARRARRLSTHRLDSWPRTRFVLGPPNRDALEADRESDLDPVALGYGMGA